MTHVAYKSDVLQAITDGPDEFFIANFERTNYYHPNNWVKTSNNGNIKIPITGVYQLMLGANALTLSADGFSNIDVNVYLNGKVISTNDDSFDNNDLTIRFISNNYLFNKNDDISIKVKSSGTNGTIDYYLLLSLLRVG